MHRSRLAALLAALALAGFPAASTAETAPMPQAVAAKTCSSGYVHAIVPTGEHKCLRRGQYCSRKLSYQRVYHRKGFHCKTTGRLGYY